MPSFDEVVKKISQQLMVGSAPIVIDRGDGQALMEQISLYQATLAITGERQKRDRETLEKAREVVEELLGPNRLSR